jgi:hypothetical protein
MGILQDARAILREAKETLLQKPNVVATGIGYKVTGGKATGDLSLICSVATKQAQKQLKPKDLIPKEVSGIPTDVLPTGVIRALDRPGRHRPALGGHSIGHYNITAGTLGCLVKRNDEVFILSNNHVLANSNNAEKGDDILQPGPYDGGTQPDKIATLEDFVPISFVGDNIPGMDQCPIGKGTASILNAFASFFGCRTRMKSYKPQTNPNLVDAALARPLQEDLVSNEIFEIGTIQGIQEAELGAEIQKSGRTTEHTTGSINQIDVTVQVNYGGTKIARFEDQLMAGAMSAGGDSGSAVLSTDNQLVGLLFAGSDTTTIINRIQNVFSELKITAYC